MRAGSKALPCTCVSHWPVVTGLHAADPAVHACAVPACDPQILPPGAGSVLNHVTVGRHTRGELFCYPQTCRGG